MPCRLSGPMCVVHGCLKPVRELGGYCLSHWMNLSALQRKGLQDDAEWAKGDTVPIPSQEIKQACDLEDLWDTPSFGEEAA